MGIFLYDSRAVVEYGNGELFVIFLLISVEIVKYQLAACGIILDHADSNIAHCNLPVLSFAPHHCLA